VRTQVNYSDPFRRTCSIQSRNALLSAVPACTIKKRPVPSVTQPASPRPALPEVPIRATRLDLAHPFREIIQVSEDVNQVTPLRASSTISEDKELHASPKGTGKLHPAPLRQNNSPKLNHVSFHALHTSQLSRNITNFARNYRPSYEHKRSELAQAPGLSSGRAQRRQLSQ